MKRIILFILGVFVSTNGWAVPATNVRLNYNLDTQILHVEADHPTDRLDRYYIRSVVVTTNSKESKNFYFPRQISPSKFMADLNFIAKGGDHLDIQIFSSEGGMATASLDISKPAEAP